MEYFDILDENGVPTGEIASRDEAHAKGLWHRAIVVAVVNGKNEILLQKRAKNKKKRPSMWDVSVAGHVSCGQDSLSAAIREINEEIELDLPLEIDIKDFRFMFSYRCQETFYDGTIENQIYDFFILRMRNLTDASKIRFQDEEVEEVKFVTASKLNWLLKNDLTFVQRPIYYSLLNYLYRY